MPHKTKEQQEREEAEELSRVARETERRYQEALKQSRIEQARDQAKSLPIIKPKISVPDYVDALEKLEVTVETTDGEVKKSYYRLAQKYHPDKETRDEEKFKDVKEAWGIIQSFRGID